MAADALLCVSDGVAVKYRELGFENCITVRNSICFERLDEFDIIDKESFRNGRKYSVLMFGYDFYIKGIDTAIEALCRYDTNNDIMLNICVASHREKAIGYIEDRFGKMPDRIRILPPRNDVATYMRAADAFLSASRTEGFAYAAMEAAYCGTAVVLSEITAHSELAIPDAVMFDPGDEAALYKALMAAFRSEKTDTNKLYAEKNFSIENWITQMCSILLGGN
ncbi:MAG: glycosyltransferase family 4 protein [Clostridia bacterium]|nr:glycosyltransferase family 4 protein [Clostridia bacterium]